MIIIIIIRAGGDFESLKVKSAASGLAVHHLVADHRGKTDYQNIKKYQQQIIG